MLSASRVLGAELAGVIVRDSGATEVILSTYRGKRWGNLYQRECLVKRVIVRKYDVLQCY